jgi:hypothetical protein
METCWSSLSVAFSFAYGLRLTYGPEAHLTPLVLGPDPSKTLGEALDPLGSTPCNVHLVLMLLDCIVVTLFPELAVDGVMDEGAKVI